MNNEELAMNLRTEMNTYLKNTVADLQQEIAETQDRINAEVERHRDELGKTFQDLLAKGSAAGIDDNFARVVTDHLQMAFEDGAKEAEDSAASLANGRAAEAEKQLAEMQTRISELEGHLAEAERKSAENQQPVTGFISAPASPADYTAARDAINEISSQTSQAEILKSLVKHASSLAPRGAFFIVKSDHLVGWRVFGREITGSDESVREIFLPVNGDTLLGKSIRENSVESAASGDHLEDAQYLQKLNFGSPAKMTAIPLVVRGRGVAVLYADAGDNGSNVQIEALESLVRVASLTVELLAAAKSSATKPPSSVNKNSAPIQTASMAPATSGDFSIKEKSFESSQPSSIVVPSALASSSDVQPINSVEADRYEERNGNSSESRIEMVPESFDKSSAEDFSFGNSRSAAPESINLDSGTLDGNFPATVSNDFSASPAQTSGETVFSLETAAPSYDVPVNYTSEAENSQPAPRRYNERNSELPIDVPEDERRLHNDARRFARLLVSEIKLYNEQKVKEGRQARDLYSRLREAIERSREMYDKRVAPPVAARFDYFHYELINTLAEGDDNRLGENYPGATI